jgi:hypothetical protein
MKNGRSLDRVVVTEVVVDDFLAMDFMADSTLSSYQPNPPRDAGMTRKRE